MSDRTFTFTGSPLKSTGIDQMPLSPYEGVSGDNPVEDARMPLNPDRQLMQERFANQQAMYEKARRLANQECAAKKDFTDLDYITHRKMAEIQRGLA